jgi:hypothetical protein
MEIVSVNRFRASNGEPWLELHFRVQGREIFVQAKVENSDFVKAQFECIRGARDWARTVAGHDLTGLDDG